MTSFSCRLCGGIAHHAFNLTVLTKYDVGYYCCAECGSLQTEPPYWLREAYEIPGVHIDTGQAARVIQTWLRLSFLLSSIGFDRTADAVDYGGSAGLLTRLMRDQGYQYFDYDPYDGSKYANYFKIEALAEKAPKLITAFEVFEHLPDPKATLTELLTVGADLIVFSTQLYQGQGPDWEYLVPICGQHVFFYAPQALHQLGARHGYVLCASADFMMLVRQASPYLPAIGGLKSTL